MLFDETTICEVCKEADCRCILYKCPCGRLELNCKWPVDENCPCRICDELSVNCSCHKPLERKDEE